MQTIFAPFADLALVGGKVITVNPRNEVAEAVGLFPVKVSANGGTWHRSH